jgi:hypothetical protein
MYPPERLSLRWIIQCRLYFTTIHGLSVTSILPASSKAFTEANVPLDWISSLLKPFDSSLTRSSFLFPYTLPYPHQNPGLGLSDHRDYLVYLSSQ